ncbi:MAG: DUF4430 domain-containing protein [Patescibacteria group bacterium]|nr:DUF4430 domain-containing protein [Patescibacteria group bacterium]
MKERKLYLSLFILVAVLSGIIFGAQTVSTYQALDKLGLEGDIAGAESIMARRRAFLAINYEDKEKELISTFSKGETVFDVLEKADKDELLDITIEESDFGVLIKEIDGYKNGEKNKYWMYYVNGEMPMVGVDSFELSAGDEVEFKFEKSSF